MRENGVKRTLAAGGVAVGTMVFEFYTTGIGRIVAAAGADFILFDQEHTGFSVEGLRMLMATCPDRLVSIVRVPATQYHLLAGPLDIGAMGLMVPMVESEEQARTIVRSAKYPPAGRRGAAFAIGHDGYADGDNLAKMTTANAETLLIAQIETTGGVEEVERIAAVEGIDVLWIGHYDLTNSMGIPSQFDHPDYLRAVDRTIAAATRHGKAVGYMASSIPDGEAAIRRGFRCLAYSGDIWVYRAALRVGVAALKGAVAG